MLRDLLSRWPETPKVDLVTTDGFLYSNEELERRGLTERKGFPESYDRRALLRFVSEVKAGVPEVVAPVYSHLVYDIVPDERIVVSQPDILIVEGINVLQTPAPNHPLAVSDLFDFSIYVDARARDIRQWFLDRFLRLRESAFSDPNSYFKQFAELDDETALATADKFWTEINRAQPGKEHPSDPAPCHTHSAQGERPPGSKGVVAEIMTVVIGGSALKSWSVEFES